MTCVIRQVRTSDGLRYHRLRIESSVPKTILDAPNTGTGQIHPMGPSEINSTSRPFPDSNALNPTLYPFVDHGGVLTLSVELVHNERQ